MPLALVNTPPWNVEVLLRLVVAAALGALIGIEREHHGRSAGLRTHLLVALGSTLAMVVSLHFGRVYGGGTEGAAIRVDPARVAYGVMGGIGFLGAGAIIRYGVGVRGLTTAASLWCTAAVGLACGFGMYLVACVAAAIVLFALVVLTWLDRKIPVRRYKALTVKLPLSEEDALGRLRQIVSQQGVRVLNVDYACDREARLQTVTLQLALPPRARLLDLIRLGEQMPEISEISLR